LLHVDVGESVGVGGVELDSFNCASGTADPLSWLDLVNNGSFIVKNA
jgi:hypothetical protein